MESNHTKINLNDGKLQSSWGKSKKYWLFGKIQTNYRPFLTIFLRKSVLQTKIIFTDQIVITALSNHWRTFRIYIRTLRYLFFQSMKQLVQPPTKPNTSTKVFFLYSTCKPDLYWLDDTCTSYRYPLLFLNTLTTFSWSFPWSLFLQAKILRCIWAIA